MDENMLSIFQSKVTSAEATIIKTIGFEFNINIPFNYL